MRAKTIVLLVAILAVAGFTALNWSEFMRTAPLSFGWTVTEASLPLVLLGVLFVTLLAFLVTSATQRTQNLLESRDHAKALQAQRDLADRAEASRFTDLRQHMDTQLRENRQREVMAASEFERTMQTSNRELRTQLEQMNRTLAGRLSEIEARLESRIDRAQHPVSSTL